jgi:hypothetical protein
MAKKRIKTIDELKTLQKKLLPCPFCGCKMGIFLDGFGFTLKHTEERSGSCFIAYDSYSSYGCADSLADDWNQRSDF